MRALHDLGNTLFPNGLPPYPEWWAEIEAAAAGGQSKSRETKKR